MEALDCQMSQTKCAILQAGINAMKAHANAECRLLGGFAQDRFDALSDRGFREEPQYPGFDMSVYTNLSTGQPIDGYTNVYPSFWSTPAAGEAQATGALIVHEEGHHQGLNESDASAIQDRCLNSQA